MLIIVYFEFQSSFGWLYRQATGRSSPPGLESVGERQEGEAQGNAVLEQLSKIEDLEHERVRKIIIIFTNTNSASRAGVLLTLQQGLNNSKFRAKRQPQPIVQMRA
ncbi:Hypothetical_protein [Hexamita inflata]|uniref:Hypothetical_protein n=1 Tax=Hexamita inflata TaxID=28002 RepID=A0AA86QJH0_9EUKA|nr:Hypothetical protein HINF_LOCUS44891 [Hexamita inflata]